jgi:hypothetical protein
MSAPHLGGKDDTDGSVADPPKADPPPKVILSPGSGTSGLSIEPDALRPGVRGHVGGLEWLGDVLTEIQR